MNNSARINCLFLFNGAWVFQAIFLALQTYICVPKTNIYEKNIPASISNIFFAYFFSSGTDF